MTRCLSCAPTVITSLPSTARRSAKRPEPQHRGGREAPVVGASMNARLPPEEAIGADLLDLVRRCQGGDPDAWRALLAPFQEIGRRALRSFRLPTADSEDILADALTALYAGGLSQFRGGTVAEFIAFLQAVVRNRAIDFVKGQKRQEGHRRNWRQRG